MDRDNVLSNLVNIRVINETGMVITDVKFTGSDGLFYFTNEMELAEATVAEEIAETRPRNRQQMRQELSQQLQQRRLERMHNRGQGGCLLFFDDSYTLSWYCEDGYLHYTQQGGRIDDERGNAHRFQFGDGQQRVIVLNANDTWDLVNL